MSECHNGHIRCIDRTTLSVLTAARRASREGEDVDAKVVQIHKDGATPRVSVYANLKATILFIHFLISSLASL